MMGASMMNESKTFYAPLTKELRSAAVSSIDARLSELDRCDDTPYVNLYKVAYSLEKSLLSALPDGYPVPMTKN